MILGNSGGGSLMGAYQAEARQPDAAPRQARGPPAEAWPTCCRPTLYVSLDAHQGRPEVLTDWMDASAVDERTRPRPTRPRPVQPRERAALPAGVLARYRAAQVARNQRITDWAKAELARLTAAGVPDILFPLSRTWADLRMVDPAIDPSSRKPHRCYRATRAGRTGPPGHRRIVDSLRTWLSMWSLETSKCRAEPHLANLHVPTFVVSADSDTGVYPSDAKGVYAAVAAADKSFASLPGDHYFLAPDGARDKVADLLAGWVSERYAVS